MTWRVSPEDWLQDFTSVPRSRPRAGESLDPVDDQLRLMLRWPDETRLVDALKRRKPVSRPPSGHPEPKLVIPSMIASKPRQPAPAEAQPAADPFAALLDPAAPQEPHTQRTTPAQQAAAPAPATPQPAPAPTRRGPRRGPRRRRAAQAAALPFAMETGPGATSTPPADPPAEAAPAASAEPVLEIPTLTAPAPAPEPAPESPAQTSTAEAEAPRLEIPMISKSAAPAVAPPTVAPPAVSAPVIPSVTAPPSPPPEASPPAPELQVPRVVRSERGMASSGELVSTPAPTPEPAQAPVVEDTSKPKSSVASGELGAPPSPPPAAQASGVISGEIGGGAKPPRTAKSAGHSVAGEIGFGSVRDSVFDEPEPEDEYPEQPPPPEPVSGDGAGIVIPSLTRASGPVEAAAPAVEPVHDHVEPAAIEPVDTEEIEVTEVEVDDEVEVDVEEDVEVDVEDDVVVDVVEEETIELDLHEATEAPPASPPPARRERPRAPAPKAPPPAPARPPAARAAQTPPRAPARRPAPTPRDRPPSVPSDAPELDKGKLWYEGVFAEHYLAVEPRDRDVASELDAKFIMRALKPSPGASLLDVGCGAGWHCLAFAKRKLEVTGLDASKPQLMRATQKKDREKASIKYLLGDMRSLPRDRVFDIVTCLGTTFGYFDDEQNRQCLVEMREVLKPGGKLVLQVTNRDFQLRILPSRSWWEGRSSLVLDVAEFDGFKNRMKINRTIVFEDGRQFEHKMRVRVYSMPELVQLVRSVGFRVVEVSGNRETPGRSYGAASPEVWIVAERSAG